MLFRSLCKHFLTEYPSLVNKISVTITEDNWERLSTPDSSGRQAPHKHAFRRVGPSKHYAVVVGEKRPSTALTLSVRSGVKNLDLLKTTQSGFVDFSKCKYTSLPEVPDRILGTSAEIEWTFDNNYLNQNVRINFRQVNNLESITCLKIIFSPQLL